MLAFSEAQVISDAVVFSDTDKRVGAWRRRNGGRSDCGRAASDDKRSGITPLKKYQACRNRPAKTIGSSDLASIRTNPPQGRGIDDTGGQNMRFREAHRLAAQWNELRIVRVRLRRIPLSIADGVVREERVFGGDDVVKTGQHKIFVNLLHRTVVVVGGSRRQTVHTEYLGTIGRRPECVSKWQHALLQIGNRDEGCAVGTGARRIREREVTRQKTLAGLHIRINPAAALC